MCPIEDDCFDFRNYGTPFYDDIRQYVYIVIINLKQRDLHIITNKCMSCYYKYIAQEEFIYHNMKSVKLHVNYKDMYMLLQIYYNKCTIIVSITIFSPKWSTTCRWIVWNSVALHLCILLYWYLIQNIKKKRIMKSQKLSMFWS